MDEILVLAAEVMRQPTGVQMVVTLLRYLGRSAIKVDKEEVMQKFVALLPKEGGVLMQTMAEEWIEEGKVIGRQEGRQEGEEKGRKEGRQEAVRAMILHLLQRRFASQATLFPYIEQQLTQIQDEASLNQLMDIALEVFVLPDFVVRLQEFVPRS